MSVPIAASLGLSSIWALQLDGQSISVVGQKVFAGIDKFVLMAIPFFILAGNVMQNGGIARRLMNLASTLVGWFRGGFGAATVLSTMFFSSMSGSSSATTAAIGTITIPQMEKKGIPKNYATALVASSGELGAIIPPSTTMIIYGFVANVSIGGLFLAGILPGLLIGFSLIITFIILAKIMGFDPPTRLDKKIWIKELWTALKDAFWALMMPVIILGGIYFGYFTPTEAAVVAVVYGFIIGFFVYKEIKIKDLMNIFTKSAITSAIVLLIVGFSAIFSYILTVNKIPHVVGEMIVQMTNNPYIFLLLVNIVVFIAGMFMETAAAILIIAPILTPVATQFGIDPIHFGIIIIVNLAIGMVTPPVSLNLFLACKIANLRIEQLAKPMFLFLSVLVVNLLVITYIPAISLWILSL